MIEGQIVAGAAILARKTVAQKNVESCEGRVRGRLYESFQRNHARQLHLEAWAAHCAVVIGDDVHPLEKHRLDGILPGPERQRVIAQRTEVRVQHQRGKPRWRYVSVQDPTSCRDSLAAVRRRALVYREA